VARFMTERMAFMPVKFQCGVPPVFQVCNLP
jgi:hypothetical protein